MKTRTNVQSPTIQHLRKELKKGNINAINEFYARIKDEGTPLIESLSDTTKYKLVTFLWIESLNNLNNLQETIENIVVLDGIAGEDFKANQLTKLENTDIWYKSFIAKSDTRTIYSFSINDPLLSEGENKWAEHIKGIYTLDPLNPKTVNDTDSLLELPDAPPEIWLNSDKMTNKIRGKIEHHLFTSEILENKRDIWIYLPQIQNAQKSRTHTYPMVLFFDGEDYLKMSTTTILDNLIHSNTIQPMIGVFVSNPDLKSRELELMCNEKFNQFLVDELLLWISTKYNVSKKPKDILIGGVSAGGNAAVFAGYHYPQVFGNIFSQSGGFWWIKTEGYLIQNHEMNNEKEYGFLIRKFVESKKLPLTFHLSVGIYDTATMENQFTNHLISNRHMRDVLEAKVYNVSYIEYSGSHDWAGWRSVLPNILINFNNLLDKETHSSL